MKKNNILIGLAIGLWFAAVVLIFLGTAFEASKHYVSALILGGFGVLAWFIWLLFPETKPKASEKEPMAPLQKTAPEELSRYAEAKAKLERFLQKKKQLESQGYTEEGLRAAMCGASYELLNLKPEESILQKADFQKLLEKCGEKDIDIKDISLHKGLNLRWRDYWFHLPSQRLCLLPAGLKEIEKVPVGPSQHTVANNTPKGYPVLIRYDGEAITYSILFRTVPTKDEDGNIIYEETKLVIYAEKCDSILQVINDIKELDSYASVYSAFWS